MQHGYFPDDLPAGRSFDVITFNDVFEHLPNVGNAMQAARIRLAPGGVLVINVPVRTGFFYRAASLFRIVGVRKPLERLWQKGFPSPHLSYFRADHLRRLAERHGLCCELERPLRTVQREGLWQRLRYDRRGSRLLAALVYGGVVLSLPLLRLLPSDSRVFFFR